MRGLRRRDAHRTAASAQRAKPGGCGTSGVDRSCGDACQKALILSRIMRILSLATLFPNPVKPSFGVFVGNQMRAVVTQGEVDLAMMSPIGVPPWPLSMREPYVRLKDVPEVSDAAGLKVQYPKLDRKRTRLNYSN